MREKALLLLHRSGRLNGKPVKQDGGRVNLPGGILHYFYAVFLLYDRGHGSGQKTNLLYPMSIL
jgi:hypothetical protein